MILGHEDELVFGLWIRSMLFYSCMQTACIPSRMSDPMKAIISSLVRGVLLELLFHREGDDHNIKFIPLISYSYP